MTLWDPETYLGYASERTRPAVDLLARVVHDGPRLVVDLGCGAGELTRALGRRWPGARVIGIDHSAEMLERAAATEGPAGENPAEESPVEWARADLRDWEPPEPVDVLVSNAALQWIPDHELVVPALFGHVAPGGTLGFQVPQSHGEPLLVAMREVLGTLARPDVLERADRPWVLGPEAYGDLLAPLARELDVWETRYQHRLTGEDPVLEWVRGTALRPVLQGLSPDELERFLALYRPRLRACYPRRTDGTTVLPFPRLFVVARK